MRARPLAVAGDHDAKPTVQGGSTVDAVPDASQVRAASVGGCDDEGTAPEERPSPPDPVDVASDDSTVLQRSGLTGEVGTEQLVARLTLDYARRLPAKAAHLRRCMASIRKPAVRSDARRLAHQLAGTAGSYGFREISRAAARLEQLLRDGADVSLCQRESQRLAELAGEAHELARELAESASNDSGSGRRARILLVDDDPDFCALVEDMGRRQLIDVVCAQSSGQALQAATGGWLDGAIIDVNLAPGESSYELAEQLKGLPGKSRLPIAFISADHHEANRVAAANSGAMLFVAKPLTLNKLDDVATQLAAMRGAESAQVLIVDDDVAFLKRAAAVLGQSGLRTRTLTQTENVLPELETLDPDALLLDVNMPKLGGLDLCRILRTDLKTQDLPILMVTESTDDSLRLEGYRAGCDDFMVKPIADEEFQIRVGARIQRRKMSRARLERDPLTGLSLRRAFMERLRARLAAASRHDQPVAIALLDLDHFKHINDSFGHLAGDRVLSHLGRLLITRFRTEDLRARWGGEEFALAFFGETASSIAPAIEQLLTELQNECFRGDRGATFRASFSAGLAELPGDGQTIETLLRVADRRLYEVKANGRGWVLGPSPSSARAG